MHIRLPYGNDSVPVDVPDNWINGRCYRPQPIEPCGDARAELMAALATIEDGEDALSARAEGKKTCAIAVDSAAPKVIEELLPALIEEVEDASDLHAADIVIVLSNRLWNPYRLDHINQIVPEETRAHYRVILHDPFEQDMIYNIGESSKKFQLTINKAYAEADLKIVLGGVQPDLIAGFTGGRAILMPGLAGEETLREVYGFNTIQDRHIRYGSYRDNPFHIAGMETARFAGCDLCVSAILTPSGDIARVHAGQYAKSHLDAMNDLRDSMSVRVKEYMDIVVTSGGGDPHDRTLAQIVRALCAVEHVLKPDGTIVIAASLEDGIGPHGFAEVLLNHNNVNDTMEKLSRIENFNPGQWVAQRLYDLLQKHEIILYNTSMDEDLIWKTGLTPASSMDEAILGAMESHGQRCKIVALPDGPHAIGTLVRE